MIKKITTSALLLGLFIPGVMAQGETDTSKLKKVDLEVKTFSSCDAMNKEMKRLAKLNIPKYPIHPIMTTDMDMVGGIAEDSATQKEVDYTNTNNQVSGIEEGDIIKTNGKYIYFYDTENSELDVHDVQTGTALKSVNLPKTMFNTKLFLNDNSLTIVGTMNTDLPTKTKNDLKMMPQYFYDINTFVIVFKLDDNGLINSAQKVSKVNGYVTDVREIDNKLYIISNKDIYSNIIDSDFDIEQLLPKVLLVERNGNKVEFVKNQLDCSEIEYLIPSDETIKNGSFNNTLNIITTIDTTDLNKVIPQRVIYGNVNTMYMSHNNIYLTSNIYLPSKSDNFCTWCIMPRFNSGNTLLYKYNVDTKTGETSYDNYTMLPGSPLTQYSMNEDKDGDFAIVTQDNSEKQGVNIFSLDKDLKKQSVLENVGKNERFQSSRFIDDKLYLVTFERTDPFFVIDLEDKKNLKILGELKIPGFSTYLHPYDKDHIIGIGRDTEEKEDMVKRKGIKIDLYDISDLNNPKQKYTYTFGTNNTHSEVLNNPRMFMYKDNVLVFPYDTYGENAEQGSIAIKIDKEKGISKIAMDTHIDDQSLEDDRQRYCSEIIRKINDKKKSCVITITGEEVCLSNGYNYLPKACEAGSTLDDYKKNELYNSRSLFIKRNLIIGDKAYSVSSNKVTSMKVK